MCFDVSSSDSIRGQRAWRNGRKGTGGSDRRSITVDDKLSFSIRARDIVTRLRFLPDENHANRKSWLYAQRLLSSKLSSSLRT